MKRVLEKALILDLDGTLCDSSHRTTVNSEGIAEYKDSDQEILDDKPIYPVVKIARAFHLLGYGIYILSARSEKYQNISEFWLLKENIHFDRLICKPLKLNDCPDAFVKLKMIKEIEDRLNIIFCIDDNPQVCRMYRERGLQVLEVKPKL